MSKSQDDKTIFLELGQIIQINASNNIELHEKIYIIDYLDEENIELVQQDDLSRTSLVIHDGNITEESIESIFILDNPVEKGYARQNDLVPNNWISVYFGGNEPMVLNGLISDIEEDMIEITTLSNKDVIYIDFEYKGIPKNFNIVSINLIDEPTKKSNLDEEEVESKKISKSPEDLENEDDDELELNLDLDLDTEEQQQNINEIFIDLEDIEIVDEDLGEITEQIHVSENKKRYSLDSQTSDLLDELLASVPTNERNQNTLRKIHILIERYKQLRMNFSNFDDEGNAENILKKGAKYKPLVENLKTFKQKLHWIIPVIKTRKNLYDKESIMDDIDDNINILGIDFALNSEFELLYQYLSNNIPDGQNKYKFLYKNLQPYYTPHIEPYNLTNIINKIQTNTDIEVLLNNLEDFYSTTIGSSIDLLTKDTIGIKQNRFVVQRLNKGLTHLVNPDVGNKKSKLFVDKLTNNDELYLSGFLTLPSSVVKYSRSGLKTMNIYERSNLNSINFSYFNLLKDSINVVKNTIIENQEEQQLDLKNIFDKVTFFDFEEIRKFDDRNDENHTVYENYLNKIVPTIRKIFDIYKSNINVGVSFNSIVKQLEPFLIYKDDITFKQYHEIMGFVYNEIDKINKKIVINKSKYTKYLSEIQSVDSYTILPDLIDKYNQNIMEIFHKDAYNFQEDMYTDMSIKKIIDIDCGKTYLNALSLGQINFAQPIDIEESIAEEIEGYKMASQMGSSKECEPITLAKKYNDIDELERDNRSENGEIFFDSKYDDTVYDIGNAWKEQHSIMDDDSEEVINNLTKFLVENNGVKPEKAERDAAAMILGSKMVVDGDYAILDLGDMDYKYYVRDNNKWKLDKSLEGKSIDTVNFCNLKDNCIKIKKQCVGLDESKEMLQKNFLSEITDKLENQIRFSISELKLKIQNNLKKSMLNISALKRYKSFLNIQRDILQVKIGSTLDIDDIVSSPYANLRDTILSQNDLVKKYTNIQLFNRKYCREHDVNNTDESPYWSYCIDTSTKLLPTFYLTLSEAFFNQTYTEVLEIVCKNRGQLSDDGDKIIDKYSGYIIKYIEFDDSEGYDESGYKKVSREIMLENIDVQSFKYSKIKDAKFDYKTELAKHIKTLLSTFDKKLNINSESEHSFMLRLAIESLNANLIDEAKYNELVKRKEKKGKKVKPYEMKHDEVLMKSISAAYIIGVQSAIPNVISDVTFSICIKSFNGFPLNGNSDLGFINYFNCMLIHLRTKKRPWNVIPKANTQNFQSKVDSLNESLKQFIRDKLLNIDYVDEKLKQKRVWNNENKDIEHYYENVDVQEWHNYLPPLVDIKVTDLQSIGDGFEDLLVREIQNGNPEQFLRLGSLYGNIVKNCFSIFESVQKAINNEPMILTSVSNIPFLENACCIDGEPSTYYYFVNKEKSIEKYNTRIKKTSDIYNKYQSSLKSKLFMFLNDTKVVFQKIDTSFTEDIVYLSFMKYCKFNTGISLDENFNRICIKNHASFNKNDSLERKIDIMKSEGLNYSVETLKQLITMISKHNVINFVIDPPILTEKMKLENISEYLQEKDTLDLQHEEFVMDLNQLIDRFNISHKEEKSDTSLSDFNQKITKWNEEMSENIVEKLMEHGELKRNLKDLIMFYLPKNDKVTKKSKQRQERFILNWNSIGDEMYMYKEDETGYIIFDLLKDMSIDIITTYPNIILNKVNKKHNIPKHWKLSQRHINDVNKIIERDYEYFTKYYGDKKIAAVMRYVLEHNKDILMVVNAIPFYSKIISDESKNSIFNGNMLKNIGYYMFLSSIMLYIDAFNSELTIEEEKAEDNQDDSVDHSILKGRKEELEKITCNLISNYLKITESYKKILNITSKDVIKNVLKSKEKEKAKITVRLRDLADEERKVENIMKNHSLGDWSVGQTRAIFEYDENQYDKEREELEKTALMEMKMGIRDEITEFSSQIYELSMIDSDSLEFMEEQEVQKQIDREVYNLSTIAEDGEEMDDAVDYM